jgi:hypothetical protein
MSNGKLKLLDILLDELERDGSPARALIQNRLVHDKLADDPEPIFIQQYLDMLETCVRNLTVEIDRVAGVLESLDVHINLSTLNQARGQLSATKADIDYLQSSRRTTNSKNESFPF